MYDDCPNIFFVEIQEGHRQMKSFQFSDAIVTFKFMLDHISIQVLEYISSSLTIPIHCGAQRKSSYNINPSFKPFFYFLVYYQGYNMNFIRPYITAFTTHDKYIFFIFSNNLAPFPSCKN